MDKFTLLELFDKIDETKFILDNLLLDYEGEQPPRMSEEDSHSIEFLKIEITRLKQEYIQAFEEYCDVD